MAKFEEAYNYTLKFEGGYVPLEVAKAIGDSGGETLWGLARNYNPSWAGWHIVDQIKKIRSKNHSLKHPKIKYFGLPFNSNIKDLFTDTALYDALRKLHREYIFENFWKGKFFKDINYQIIANFFFEISYGSGYNISVHSFDSFLKKYYGVHNKNSIFFINVINSTKEEEVPKLLDFLVKERVVWLRDNVKKSYLNVLITRAQAILDYKPKQSNLLLFLLLFAFILGMFLI